MNLSRPKHGEGVQVPTHQRLPPPGCTSQVQKGLLPSQDQPCQAFGQQQHQHGSAPDGPAHHVVPAYLWHWYEVLGKIGEGTYGVVYLARSRENRFKTLAVKTFKPGKEGDGVSPTAIREIMLLREIEHDNIVFLDSVHINRQDPCLSLAFDYAEHDLYEIIRHHRDKLHTPLDTYTIKSLMWQLLNGLSFMEQHWVVHRDLKPSNVLVMGEGDEQGRVKIADFGLARISQAPLRPLSDNGVVVTIWYRAPELLLGARHYTSAVDVWAAGCIFAELLTLRPLFQGEEKKHIGHAFQGDQLDKIFLVLGHPSPKTWPALEQLSHWRDNTNNVRLRKPEHTCNRLEEYITENTPHIAQGYPAALRLLHRMLEYDPSTRLTAAQALQDDFFTNQEPTPGSNAFKQNGKLVAQYPRRTKFNPMDRDNAVVAASHQQSVAHAHEIWTVGSISRPGGQHVNCQPLQSSNKKWAQRLGI